LLLLCYDPGNLAQDPILMLIIFVKEMEVIAMIQQSSDQGWQQLQANIEGFLGQALRNNERTEYKPRFIAQLQEMPSERYQKELQESSRVKNPNLP
jgi:hypothetical protein